jgi:hypothetical protein
VTFSTGSDSRAQLSRNCRWDDVEEGFACVLHARCLSQFV